MGVCLDMNGGITSLAPCSWFRFFCFPLLAKSERRWRRRRGIEEPKPDSIAAIVIAVAILVFILGFVVMGVLRKYGVLAGF